MPKLKRSYFSTFPQHKTETFKSFLLISVVEIVGKMAWHDRFLTLKTVKLFSDKTL